MSEGADLGLEHRLPHQPGLPGPAKGSRESAEDTLILTAGPFLRDKVNKTLSGDTENKIQEMNATYKEALLIHTVS